MKLTFKQYAQALYDAVQEAHPKDHDLVLDKFVKILSASGNLDKHEEIEKEYRVLESENKGFKQAEVTLAGKTEINSQIVDELNKITGKKLETTTKTDESIIGGIMVRVDDTLIDASVKGQLDKLKKSLKS
ncbi:MAG: hypothetical protein COT92_02210 [Candidatus Doudnabacteria bacterium CG10_big_fil_rev_8_21_14_0_10_42_18]|uniref:Uncharacterized protein n=1 Tax=Candidatus Doudnabacteria bacterium CG10_big_fil_rev_8_21_14_0_10_42_18 TaxID=1974552 RepID=A0A2H0VAX0_9BACT|nr:MAG: hypothetical protein COT92_02210 [Candidatus Doudnabacteria bacterium CG10_big_fil_rev_8_21_14_0_10_42_18]